MVNTAKTEYYDELYDMLERERNLIIRAQYPESPRDKDGNPLYRYETNLEVIDLDAECQKDLITGNGFIITKKQNIKKDLKSDDSIFSGKFGLGLDDLEPFANRYRCKCGRLTMKANNGILCEVCKTKCKNVGDNFEFTGWIKINEPYFFINPNMFKKLICFIGKKNMDLIINVETKIDEDGFVIKKEPTKDNPFVGIGMMSLREKIDEILQFYANKLRSNAKKIDYYNSIMEDYDKIFCHSIPVYTSMLRPYSIKNNNFNFEGNNALYNVIAALAQKINNNHKYMRGKYKPVNQTLYDIQMTFMEIYADCEKLLSGKKGYIRSVIGGRYNFSARNVITPDPTLAIDEIILPYTTLIELLSLTIINILNKTMPPDEAYMMWDEARIIYNPTIGNLIQSILDQEYIGIILNRNPSISPASILQLRCVKCTQNNSYACSIPHEILASMNADFDGDTLNILHIINKDFLIHSASLYNPRLAMQISNNDGMFNSQMQLQTDTLICLNTFNRLGIKMYTDEKVDKILALKHKYDEN